MTFFLPLSLFVERMVGELFALMIYHADGYLVVEEDTVDEVQRFFSMSLRLPLELKMLLCNRVFGLEASFVRRVDSEKGFKKFAQEESDDE